MGYSICTVQLRDGRHVERVVIVGGIVTEVDGSEHVAFTEEEIVDIRVNHDR
jgi:hypothetical protein